jgi:hypothetical protein
VVVSKPKGAGIADGLKTASEQAEARRPNPKDFAPGVVVEPDLWTVTTGPMEFLAQEEDWLEAVNKLVPCPPGWRVRVVEMRYDPVAWTRDKQGEDAVTKPVWRYKFAVEPVAKVIASDEELDAFRKRVDKWKPNNRKTLGIGLGPESVLHVDWADWQVGKDPIEEIEQKVFDSYEDTVKRLKELRRIGRNVTGIAVANMGDPSEGCQGFYSNQPNTITANGREQQNIVLDLWAAGLRTLVPLAEQFWFISVLCNHGENRGADKKAVTSDSDNRSGAYADALKRIFDDRPDYEHINWEIPHSEMITQVDLAGVTVAHAHGHKMTKKEDDWLKSQSLYLLDQYGKKPRLWVTAHRHHASIIDVGPFFRIQCPSLDGGSKWYSDTTGNWSTAGTTTFLIGTHDSRGFSDWAVL